MKYTLLGLCMLFSAKMLAQKTDAPETYQDTVFIKHGSGLTDEKLRYTVIFETEMRRHILAGTAILPSTHNQQIAKGYGLYFSKVTASNCRKDVTEYGGRIRNKINSIVSTDSTLTIDVTIYDNCCYDFLCDLSVVNDATINLIYYGYGTYCDCDCCFGLTYYLTKEKYPELAKIKSVVINRDRKTIKKINTT